MKSTTYLSDNYKIHIENNWLCFSRNEKNQTLHNYNISIWIDHILNVYITQRSFGKINNKKKENEKEEFFIISINIIGQESEQFSIFSKKQTLIEYEKIKKLIFESRKG